MTKVGILVDTGLQLLYYAPRETGCTTGCPTVAIDFLITTDILISFQSYILEANVMKGPYYAVLKQPGSCPSG